MSSWSNDEILFFLECYRSEPCIWDPQDPNHKVKKKVGDAWIRLSHILNKSVKELKIKKEILMVTFRKHLKKKLNSLYSESGSDNIYMPIWFAYPLMESFLLPVYTHKCNLNSEKQSLTEGEFIIDGTSDCETFTTGGSCNTSTSYKSRPSPLPMEQEDIEQQMLKAFNRLTRDLHNPKDECDLYCKLLTMKLKELPLYKRKRLMCEIDKIFIRILDESQIPLENSSSRNGATEPSTSFQTPHSKPSTSYKSSPRQIVMLTKAKERFSEQGSSSKPIASISHLSRIQRIVVPARQNIINDTLIKSCEEEKVDKEE